MAAFEDDVLSALRQAKGLPPEQVSEVQTPSEMIPAHQQKPPAPLTQEQYEQKLETVPEFRATPYMQKGIDPKKLKLVTGMMMTFDDGVKADIIRDTLPGAKVEKDDRGVTWVDYQGQKSVINKPGWSYQDAMSAIGNILAFVPAARLSNLGRNVLTKMGLSAVGAGATEAGLQEGEKLLGSTQPRSAGRIATAAGLGTASELVGPAFRYARGGAVKPVAKEAVEPGLKNKALYTLTGKSTKKITEEAIEEGLPKTVLEAEKASAKTGVELWPAQKMLSPRELQKQSQLLMSEGAGDIAIQKLSKQNEQVGKATEKMLNLIAPESSVVGAPEAFREAAEAAITAQKQLRAAASQGLYKEAFRSKKAVPIAEFRKNLKEAVDSWPEGLKTNRTIKRLLNSVKGNQSLEKLHRLKMEMYDIITDFSDTSVGNTGRREVAKLRKNISEILEKASPEYAQANKKFAELSPALTKVENSLIGKVAKLKDTQIESIGRTMFSPTTSSVKAVTDAKKIIQGVDPQAWRQLVRAEMERKLGGVASDITAEGVENIPKMYYEALFKNRKARQLMFAAVDSETRKNLTYFAEALRRAAQGRPGRVTGMTASEARKSLQGGIVPWFRKLVGSPLRTVAGVGEETTINKRVAKLAKVMFDPTPAQVRQLRKLRQVQPTSDAAAKILAQIMVDKKKGE